MTTPVPPATDRVLPAQKTLLGWVFGARVLVAITTLVLPSLAWVAASGEGSVVVFGVLLAAALTAYGYWYVWRRDRRPGQTFLLIQALGDVALVTLLVHRTGGPDNAAPSLYILVIAAYALLLSFGGGLARLPSISP